MSKRRYKVQAVEWIDAAHSDSLYRDGERLWPVRLIEVGVVIGEDKDDLTVVSELDGRGGSRHSIAIPKKVVKRRWTIGTLVVEDGKVVEVRRRGSS